MPRQPHRPPPLRGRLFHGPTAVTKGQLTRAQLRSSAWRPVIRGVYVDSTIPPSHELSCRAVAKYLLPDSGAIAGHSAATLLGPGLNDDSAPVEVLVPRPVGRTWFVPRTAGIVAHTATFPPSDVRTVRGMPVTTPLRTCWDLTQWSTPEDAVVVLDRFLRLGLVTPPELADHGRARRERTGTRGTRRFARAVAWADGRSESPQESRLRMAIVLGGLPKPDLQVQVHDSAGFIGRVDLAYEALRIAIEYDGAWHASLDQLQKDRRRLNRLQAAGWLVIHVTADRLRHDRPTLLAEIRAAIRSRR
ncbi:endonuclease domain-containing protein [Luedemannella helvata]